MAASNSPAENLITENLDIWTSAIKKRGSQGRGNSNKIELYGIKKLRELILELAVRGLLVPQDSNDEPASILLDTIAVEKEKLIDSKIIKRPKNLPDIEESEKPYRLPFNWKWARLGDVVAIIRGITFPGSEKYREPSADRVVCLRTTNVQHVTEWDDLFYVDKKFVKREDQYVLKNDILMSMANSRELVGKVSFVDKLHVERCSFGGFVSVIRPYKIKPLYMMSILRSPHVKEALIGSASQTTNIANVSLEKLNPLVIAIPPLGEQTRIVAKVDELMALCDQLEQQTETSLNAHQTLVETLLNTLLTADQSSFDPAWERIAQHFDVLFTTEHSIDQLKQTILQLAVMGKLVPQDRNAEPASVLLEKITAEKKQLLSNKGQDKVIKKQKPLPPISDDEKPFELPKGWEWCRLGQLGYDMGGGTPSKGRSDYWNGQIPWVSPKDMKVDYIDSSIDGITELAIQETVVNMVPKNSLLIVVRGMILNHSFPVAINSLPVAINQDMKALVFSETDKDFLLVLMKGFKTNFLDLVDRSSHGTCKLISDKLWSKVIAMPPKTEQHNIAARVNELMFLCETLKARVRDSQKIQLHLADAMAAQVLN